MKLDGVLTLVDAKHVEQHLDEERPADIVNESVEQIAFADRIILNKTDLVSNDDLDRLEGRIKSINSLASIKRAERAKVDMDYVLGIGGFDLEKVDEEISKTSTDSHDHHHHDHDDHHECGPDCQEHDHHHRHEHDHHHDHHHHGDAVSSVSITIKGNLDLDKVRVLLYFIPNV